MPFSAFVNSFSIQKCTKTHFWQFAQKVELFFVFYDRLLALCQENNEKITPVIKKLGLSAGSIARWRNGTVPDGNTICKIAEYFNVSSDYLLEKTDIKKSPSEVDEDKILKDEIAKIFSTLLPEQQEQAKSYLRYLLDTQEKTSQDNS